MVSTSVPDTGSSGDDRPKTVATMAGLVRAARQSPNSVFLPAPHRGEFSRDRRHIVKSILDRLALIGCTAPVAAELPPPNGLVSLVSILTITLKFGSSFTSQPPTDF